MPGHRGKKSSSQPNEPLKIDVIKYGSCEPVDNTQVKLEPIGTSSPKAQSAGDAQLGALEKLASRIPCFGIMLAFGASFFLGSAGMLVKMTSSVHGIQVAVFR